MVFGIILGLNLTILYVSHMHRLLELRILGSFTMSHSVTCVHHPLVRSAYVLCSRCMSGMTSTARGISNMDTVCHLTLSLPYLSTAPEMPFERG